MTLVTSCQDQSLFGTSVATAAAARDEFVLDASQCRVDEVKCSRVIDDASEGLAPVVAERLQTFVCFVGRIYPDDARVAFVDGAAHESSLLEAAEDPAEVA